MNDDNDISIGPGGDDDDDDEKAPTGAAVVERAAPPPPIIDHRRAGGAPAPAPAVAAPAATAPEPAAITPKAAPAASPAPPPIVPAARPTTGGPRLVSADAPAAPAPATPTPSAPNVTEALAAQLASLQQSIESLTAGQKAQPAPAAPAAAPAAPEAAETEPPELDEKAVERDLATFAEKDRDCVAWSALFKRNDARITEIAKEFAPLSRAVDVLQAQIDPKAYGLQDEAPDDVTRAELEQKLEPKLAKQERLRLEHQRLVGANESLDAKFNDRISQAEAKIRERFQTKAATVQAGQKHEAEMTAAEREWHSAFKAEVLDQFNGLVDDKGKPNADALALHNRLLDLAYARVRREPNLNLKQFIKDNISDEITILNARRGKVAGDAARVKAADSHVPAPRGPAAVADAPRALSEITDPRERRRQVERDTARASKHLVLRTG